MSIEILPVQGLPEVAEGDDLAGLLAGATELRDGDVVVVSQKIVSKAEGRVVTLEPGEDPAEARRRLGREEAVRVVVDSPGVLVVETRHGFVCANAGVDASNIEAGKAVLLPVDPDASARRLRSGLAARTGADVVVVVADTFGRPWRLGQTDVAIGLAGMPALRDERGALDRAGNLMEVTVAAVADELAGAADLVRGKADGVPVVVVRGFLRPPGEDGGARSLVRPAAEDLFARGRGAVADALAGVTLAEAPQPGEGPTRREGAAPGGISPAVLERALAPAERAAGDRVELRVSGEDPVQVVFLPRTPGADLEAGLAAGLLVAAAFDLGLDAVARRAAAGEPGVAVVTLGIR